MRQTSCWDVKQTARFLGTCDTTVRRHLQRGLIPGRKMGRDWLVNGERLLLMYPELAPNHRLSERTAA